ncbi:major facilitator superfamily domain-containing protein [Pelagophyceae sp. CCMP2097]|nr:major facilitator superfamily domain-containing protein [Pelagophyceae sp. CCMP2097]
MIDDDPGWTAFPAEDPPGTDGRAVAAGAGGSRNGGDCAEGVSPGAAWRVARRRSLRLVGVIAFCEAVEYTLVVPTLFGYVAKYGATPSEYAACFSAFSIATTLVRIPFGALAMRRGYKAGYRLSIGVAVLGNVVYAVAPLAATPSWSLRLIFAGRFLAGFLGASQSLMNGYVTEAAQSKGPGETVAALSTFNLIKMIGMTAGPIFTIILAQIRFNIGPLTVDKRNAPGAAMSVILTTLLAATHCLAEPKQASPLLSRDVSDALEAGDPWRRAAAQGVAVSSLFLLFFVIGVLEAALAPVAQQVGLSTSQTSFIIGGLTALVVASGLSMNACLRRGLATEHALLCGNVAVAGAAAALGLLCATKGFGLLHFVLPLALFELSFPLLNAPARGLVHAYSGGVRVVVYSRVDCPGCVRLSVVLAQPSWSTVGSVAFLRSIRTKVLSRRRGADAGLPRLCLGSRANGWALLLRRNIRRRPPVCSTGPL